MTHALIIDDNMIVGRAIADRLASLGFDTFDRTWTEAQAMAVAERRPPDLVVIGDAIAGGSPLNVARHIAEECDAPIMLVTAGKCEVRRQLPEGAILDGPFSLSDIGDAVSVARNSRAAARPRQSDAGFPIPAVPACA